MPLFLPMALLAGCSINPGAMNHFEGVDLMGATLDTKPLDSAYDCSKWCEEDRACQAYTYGGRTTPKYSRGICYKKSLDFKFRRTDGFTSGIKR